MRAARGALRHHFNDAAVVNLACHGVINEVGNSSLLLGGVVELHGLTSDNFALLDAGPVVVLSACNVGGFGPRERPLSSLDSQLYCWEWAREQS